VPRHQASGPWSIQVCPASTPTPPFCLLQFEIRQLRAHLAQQDLDLAAEREAALQVPHVLSQPRSRYKVVEARPWDEETAAESVVEELRPSQGESAGTRASPSALQGSARSAGGSRHLAGLCPVHDGGRGRAPSDQCPQKYLSQYRSEH
jgi:hypothetical protein